MNPIRPSRLAPVALAAVFAVAPTLASEPPPGDLFEDSVRAILEESCVRCHGGTTASGKVRARGGLVLTSRRRLLAGGDSGPAIDLEHPARSLLLDMLSYRDEDHEMPPKGKLPQGDIDALSRWVAIGAPWPGRDRAAGDDTGSDGSAGGTPSGAAERDLEDEIRTASESYWAYQPVRRPDVPRVRTPTWQEHPVDAFLASRLEAAGLEPSPPASREVLIRRAFYDLTGLPPSPREVETFVADDAPDAWPRLVDRLLVSPRYGEAWARHWLDLVRYAESNGYERDSDKAEIWRYRDWVIRAFNDDVPYDRFIREQLAGDELDPVTPDSLTATGFLRLHLWDDEPVDREQARYDNLDDIVRTTAEGFLGTTLGCARCHDHKKDPIRQRDYYSFVSFFNNLTPMGKNDVFRTLEGLAPGRRAAARRGELREREGRLEARIGEIEASARETLRERGETVEGGESFKPGHVLLADSRRAPGTWLVTTERPPEGWMANGHAPDPARWKEAPGGFGRRGTPGAVVRTEWTTSDIWLRGEFRLTAIPPSVELVVHHDEDCEVFLNGELVAERDGYLRAYSVVPLGPRAVAALQTGKNILAVHCRHTAGGQYIDCGLRVGDPAPDRGLREVLARRGAGLLGASVLRTYQELRDELERVRAQTAALEADRGRVMCAAERGRREPKQHVHIRGNAHAHGEEVEPGFPAVLSGQPPVVPELPEGVASTGRRLALANWIASPENPLTARVLVNRLWQHHFGRGIVATPSDFGKLGEPPSHPELLDWLASELVAGGWRIRRMHRILLLSKAYRMSSRATERGLAADPENHLLWRKSMRRLTAEEIRDSMLSVSGSLRGRMYGPSVFPELPAEVLATSSTGAGKWGRSSEEDAARRSIYIKVKRSLLVPLLTDFDLADTDAPCAVRFCTTVPTQALGMLNSTFVNEQASLLAARIRRERPGDPDAQVRRGLELVTSRPAREDEVRSCLELMRDLRAEDGLSAAESLDRFALLALNLNEFIYLD